MTTDATSVLMGRVTEKFSGNPISGVTIEIKQKYIIGDFEHLDFIQSGKTDSQGNYSINYNYKSGKPSGYIYEGCFVSVSQFFIIMIR